MSRRLLKVVEMQSQLTRLTMLAFVFLVASSLAACASVASDAVAVFFIPDIMNENAKERPSKIHRRSHYEPVISFASESTIRVKYFDKGEYAQPEKAMKMISKHCKGSFAETSRKTVNNVTYIVAECT